MNRAQGTQSLGQLFKVQAILTALINLYRVPPAECGYRRSFFTLQKLKPSNLTGRTLSLRPGIGDFILLPGGFPHIKKNQFPIDAM